MDYNKIFHEAKKKEGLKIIKPQTSKTSPWTDLSDVKNAIFLAGPCPRSDYANNDWRTEAFKILENLCFTGPVITPTNDCYNPDNPDFLKNQTAWEYEAMHKASAIVFCLDRSDKNPGFTTNVEYGIYSRYPSCFVFCPEDNTKGANRYIKIDCEKKGIPVFTTLEDTLSAAVLDVERLESKNWFISDTHFSQERTMTLSRRPFKTVEEMDLEMISNWNKRVRKNDVVYHLGDFGEDGKYLDCLNFGILKFNKGNYERDGKNPQVLEDMKKHKDVEIYDNDEIKVESGKFKYVLRHEPISGKKPEKDEIVLYGHIHGCQLIKENGIDCGVDVHNFTPASQEEIDFFANAITEKFYDENVFTPECK